MISTTATSTEMQNNFGKYLNIVMNGGQVIVTKNGKEIGRFIPREVSVSYLTDSLMGILKENRDAGRIRDAELRKKYEIDD